MGQEDEEIGVDVRGDCAEGLDGVEGRGGEGEGDFFERDFVEEVGWFVALLAPLPLIILIIATTDKSETSRIPPRQINPKQPRIQLPHGRFRVRLTRQGLIRMGCHDFPPELDALEVGFVELQEVGEGGRF